jgi:hypothetical protein
VEELLGFFGFSLGASLGAGAVRTLAGGSRPVVREVIKAGIRAWDGLADVRGAARESLASMQADARAEQAQTRARSRRRAQPQKIIVAHE